MNQEKKQYLWHTSTHTNKRCHQEHGSQKGLRSCLSLLLSLQHCKVAKWRTRKRKMKLRYQSWSLLTNHVPYSDDAFVMHLWCICVSWFSLVSFAQNSTQKILIPRGWTVDSVEPAKAGLVQMRPEKIGGRRGKEKSCPSFLGWGEALPPTEPPDASQAWNWASIHFDTIRFPSYPSQVDAAWKSMRDHFVGS